MRKIEIDLIMKYLNYSSLDQSDATTMPNSKLTVFRSHFGGYILNLIQRISKKVSK